ncbi:MAG: hypothetical protein WD810_07910 [Solirubrobacterales bacterium]
MERLNRNAPALLLAAALVAAAAMTLVLSRDMTFFQDTWSYLITRREITVDTVLQPHNEHIVVIPVLIEQLFLRLFGMTSATPEYVLLTILLVATVFLLYVYVRRRVGPWLALFASILILCIGPAWEVLLWPFEISLVGSVFFGLAMLLAFEREDRRADIAACLFLTLSVGFSSLGIPFIAAAAVAVLQGPREAWLRRAYIFAIPAVLFAAWYLGWGHEAESGMSLRNLLASPRFVADTIAVALGSLVGLGPAPGGTSGDPLWGRALLVALVVVLGFRQLRKPGVFPGLWPVAAAAATNWFLTAFNQIPGRDPTSSRYQYVGAIFIVLILANLLKGVRLSRSALIVAGAVTVLAVGPNLIILDDGREILDREAIYTRADGAAIEIARGTVDPEFQLNPEVAGTPSLINIYAGPYLEAVDEYGSPAYSVEELISAPEEGRRQADIVLSQALPLSMVTSLAAYTGSGGRDCVALAPGDAGDREVELDAGRTRIEIAPGPHAELTLRRFATGEYPVVSEGAPGDSVTLLEIPRDESTQPWYLHVEASQLARVCR